MISSICAPPSERSKTRVDPDASIRRTYQVTFSAASFHVYQMLWSARAGTSSACDLPGAMGDELRTALMSESPLKRPKWTTISSVVSLEIATVLADAGPGPKRPHQSTREYPATSPFATPTDEDPPPSSS